MKMLFKAQEPVQTQTTFTSSPEHTRSPRAFFYKLFWFLLIPMLPYAAWAILTPITFYNFRVWEAVSPYLLQVSKAFYPYQHIEMVEVGDLGTHTDFAIPKPVTFVTDAFGYRFDVQHHASDVIDIVIVGDSMIVGSSLTQTDILSSVLTESLNQIVYPLAPATINTLLNDHRFGNQLPSTVILATVERNINTNLCPQTLAHRSHQGQPRPMHPMLSQILVNTDRVIRHYTYLRGYLRSSVVQPSVITSREGMLFYDKSIQSASTEAIPNVVTSLQRCQTWFAEQQIEFIFLPIPDRENIYFRDIPDDYRPSNLTPEERSQFLRQLIAELTQAEVQVVDLLSSYETARDAGITPYQLDDTHWNAIGVQIASDLIVEILSQ